MVEVEALHHVRDGGRVQPKADRLRHAQRLQPAQHLGGRDHPVVVGIERPERLADGGAVPLRDARHGGAHLLRAPHPLEHPRLCGRRSALHRPLASGLRLAS